MAEPAISSDFNNHLDEVLEQFETEWSPDEKFLKATVVNGGLLFDRKGITELVRADIDRRYAADCVVDLPRYFEWFPELKQDVALAQAIGFEDYRSRKTRGLLVQRDRWGWIPNIQSTDWFRDLDQLDRFHPTEGFDGPHSISRWVPTERSDAEPRAGEMFGDFQLVATLGIGAFSRVFLATQPSLANRYVAIKIVKKTLDEPEHLARLQHTGIVPIYSLHRMGSYSVLCMPYFGAATLADWLGNEEPSEQRDGQSLIGTVQQAQTRIGSSGPAEADSPMETLPSEVDRIRVWNAAGAQPLARLTHMDEKGCLLWLSRRIASALAHAHERDVIHGDLKPANVLLKNDGEPALIDFNLARKFEEKPSSHVGGTLPYMSPEQLQMLLGRRLHLSAASDIYSLGIILFQIAEGRLPFPAPLSSAESDISIATVHRKDSIRFGSSFLSAGLKSVISKCLEYDAKDRYSNGMMLLEDLDCEASNLPLKHANESFFRSRVPKLVRRYPRVFSVIPVLVLATLIGALLAFVSWYWWNQSNQWSSRNSLTLWTNLVSVHGPDMLEGSHDEIRSTFSTMDKAIHEMVGDGVRSGKVAKLGGLPQGELQISESLFFNDVLVLAGLASERQSQLLPHQLSQLERWIVLCEQSEFLNRSRTIQRLRSSLGIQSSKPMESREAWLEPLMTGPVTDGEQILQARALVLEGLPLRSIESLSEVVPRPANKALYWITVGDAQRKLGHVEAALLAFGLAINEAPKAAIGYVRRSQLFAEMRKWDEAEKDSSTLIRLNPRNAIRYAERARLREAQGKIKEAIADMDEAIELDSKANRYYFFRSKLGRLANDHQKAKEDYQHGIGMTPLTTEDWISRALAQLPKYPERAMADLKRAEQIEPNRFEVLQNQAHVLSEHMHDEDAAIRTLTRILDHDSDNEWARVDRCVLLAREGRKEEVLMEVESVLSRGTPVGPATHYQIACAYSLLAVKHFDCREPAFQHLSKAILGGYGYDLLETDKDLDSLRMDSHFNALIEVTRLSQKTAIQN